MPLQVYQVVHLVLNSVFFNSFGRKHWVLLSRKQCAPSLYVPELGRHLERKHVGRLGLRDTFGSVPS